MNEKQIALTVLAAQKMREESYSEDLGDYTLSIETCLMQGAKRHELSDNMWALLALAMHWWNDIQDWAKDVLAGKNILDELDTASKIDAQERGVSVGPQSEYTEVDSVITDKLPNLCDTCESITADCNSERETIGNTNHVIKCVSYKKQDRLVNLCDTCVSNFPDCDTVGMEFGDGVGHDNVIVCFAYTIKEYNHG